MTVGILLVGGNWPVNGGAGSWDWWGLAGFAALLMLVLTARRRPPVALCFAIAAVGGLLLADLTDAFGVVPVWGPVLLVALFRNLWRGRQHPSRFDRPSEGGAQ